MILLRRAEMGKGGTATTDSPPAERPADENPANDSNMQPATVHLLDATKQIFYVPKKAEGKELFDKVVDYLKLVEKEYFGLSFLDTDGNRHWIYEDKRITKQLKGHPWEFNFEVKFYPPDPAALTDDLTRYQLTLQIRHDVYTGRLPATFATLALLGSYIAQAERGDFHDTPDYDDFLRDCRLAPVPSTALYEKIRELHKQHKGETPAEAELHYLDNAKKLSMYGIFLFPAKDSKGTSVHVGVCAHGINVYCDQIRAHRFIWQNIIKIAYRRNTFSIKLQPGELDRSAVLFHLKVPDYASAKRIWKCAVEHHTFFRLIQPDEKPHKGLFRWGSGRFRYQGRTHFQSKMASQMFDHPAATVKRSHSARLASRSDENLAPEAAKHTSPLHYADDGTSHDLTNTPEKSYTLHSVDISGRRDMKKIAKTSEVEVGECDAIFDGSAALVHDDSRSPPAASFGHTTYSSPLRFSPYSARVSQAAQSLYGRADQELRNSAEGQHENLGFEQSQPIHKGSDISELRKEDDLQFGPLSDTVVVYHPGHYEEISRSGGPMREPPIEAGDDIVFIPRGNWKRAVSNTQSAAVTGSNLSSGLLEKGNELGSWPIKYFVNVYHSGFEKYSGGNKDIDNFERAVWEGCEEVISCKDVDKSKYPPKSDVLVEPVMRMERSIELPAASLRLHSSVYHCGYSYPVIDESPEASRLSGKWLRSDIIKAYGASPIDGPKSVRGEQVVRESSESVLHGNRDDDVVHVQQSVDHDHLHRPFAYTTHGGKIEVVGEGDVRPKTYGLPSTSYDGPLENVSRAEEMSSTPIRDHVSVYHSGTSTSRLRKLRIPKVRLGLKSKQEYNSSSSELSEDESKETAGTDKRKKKAIFHMRNLPDKASEKATATKDVYDASVAHPCTTSESSNAKLLLAKTKEYDAGDLKIPQNRRFVHSCHEGEVEVVEKVDVKPETYDLPSTSYEGPLQSTKRDEELNMIPIRDHSAIYHSGLSFVKPKIPKVAGSMRGKAKEESSSEESSNGREEAEETIERANYEESQRGGKKFGESGARLFSFWRSSGRKVKDGDEQHGTSVRNGSTYPAITSQVHNGPVDSTDKSPELESTLLRAKVSIYNSEQTGLPGTWTDYRVFDRAVHEGDVDFVEKSEVDPQSYGVSYEPYVGHFERTVLQRELVFVPLKEHSAKYHSGQSWNPTVQDAEVDNTEFREKFASVDKNKDGASGLFSSWSLSDRKSRSTPVDGHGYPLKATQAHTGHAYSIFRREDIQHEPFKIENIRKSAEGTVIGCDSGETTRKEKTSGLPPISCEEYLATLDKGRDLPSVPFHRLATVSSPGEGNMGNVDGFEKHVADGSKESADYHSLGQSPQRKLDSTEIDARDVPCAVDYPVITSHVYAGPLQSVSRSKDIPSEPLHTIVTVYSSDQPKQLGKHQRPQVFRHTVHEGDVEIIEKGDVNPISYGLPCPPYQGPLETVYREGELPSTPIRDHSSVYHSGISYIKLKKPKLPKFGFGLKRMRREESSSGGSLSGDEVDAEGGGQQVICAEGSVTEKVGACDDSHFPLWHPHGWRRKASDGVAEPGSSTEHSALSGREYTKPVVSIERSDDLATRPLNIRVVSEQVSRPRLRDRLRDYHLFMHARHGGDVEFVEKVDVKTESYNLSSVAYDGALEHTGREEDLPFTPVLEYAAIYHSGLSYVKTRKPKLQVARFALAKRETEETSSESSSGEETDESKRTAGGLFSFWRSSDRRPKADEVVQIKATGRASVTSSPVHGSERSKEQEKGKWNTGTEIHPKRPKLRQRLGDYRLFGRIRCDGAAEVIEKGDVNKESYRLQPVPYEGPLESIHREEELSSTPICDYSSVYHPGRSYIRAKKAISSSVTSSTESLSDEGIEESGKKEDKDVRGGLFTFWRSSDRKKKNEESSAASIADGSHSKQPIEVCSGLVRDRLKQEDMGSGPCLAAAGVPPKTKPKLRQRLGDYRLFGHFSHGGKTEIIDKKDVKPESYKLSPIPYDGVLLNDFPVKDLEFMPIRDCSAVYHSGLSYMTTKKVKLPKLDAILRRSWEESSSESASDEGTGRSEDDAKGAKEGGGGLFSFWRSPVRKSEEKNVTQMITADSTQQAVPQRELVDSIAETKEVESQMWQCEAGPPVLQRQKLRDRLADYLHFGRAFHEGEEDSVSKHALSLQSYKLSSVPYEGSLENMQKEEELLFAPIHEHSSVYHSGKSYVRTKHAAKPSAEGEESKVNKVEESSSESPSEEDSSFIMKKALLNARRPLNDAGKRKEGHGTMFSLWRASDGRTKGAKAISGPVSAGNYSTMPSGRCSGPVYDTEKTEEMKTKSWNVENDVVAAKRPKMRERLNNYRLFRHYTHEGEVDVVDKIDVNPESYEVPLGRYEGKLWIIQRNDELSAVPLVDCASVYHPGTSYIKLKQKKTHRASVDEVMRGSESSSESSSESVDGKQTAKEVKGASRSVFSFWHAAERKAKEDAKMKQHPVQEPHQLVASSSTGLVITMKKTEEMGTAPLTIMPKVHRITKPKLRERLSNYRLFGRAVHEGDVDIIEKEDVKPETYGLSTSPFEGALDSISYVGDLSFAPISEHSSVYHPGTSFLRSKKVSSMNVGLRFMRSGNEELSSESSSEDEIGEGKKTALLYLKSAPAEENRRSDSNSGLFSFWRSSGSKAKDEDITYKAGRSTSSSDASKEPARGQEHSDVHLYKRPSLKERLKDYRLFGRATTGGGTEVTEKSNVNPESYKLSSELYSGPLEHVSYDHEIPFQPIRDYSSVYHPGTSYMKSKKALSARLKFFGDGRNSEEESESSDDNGPEVVKTGATALVKDEYPEVSSTKEATGGLFSFWRASERKAKEQKPSSGSAHRPGAPTIGFAESSTYPVHEIMPAKKIFSTSQSTNRRLPKAPTLRERLGDYRLFGRAVHDGEEDIVEKHNVIPSSYKLSGDPYSGKLEEITLAQELSFSPIRDSSSVYHPGTSYVKTRKQLQQPCSLAKKAEEQSVSESSSGEEQAQEKQKGVLHIKDWKVADDASKGKVGGLFSFWWSSDRSVSGARSASAVEKQVPIESVADLGGVGSTSPEGEMVSKLNEKVVGLQLNRPKLRERLADYRLFRRVICHGDQEFTDKCNVKPETYKLSSVPFTGVLERTEREEELEFSPVREHSSVYHLGTSYLKGEERTGRLAWKGKRKIANAESTNESSTPESDDDDKKGGEAADKIEGAAGGLQSFCRISGRSEKEPDAHVKSASDVESRPNAAAMNDIGSVNEIARTKEFRSRPLLVGIQADDRAGRPRLRDRINDYRLFGRSCHEGASTVIEKSAVAIESYNLPTDEYRGPLETVTCTEELPFRPIRDCVTVYHPGRSFIKGTTRRPEKCWLEKGSSEEISSSSSTEDEFLETKALQKESEKADSPTDTKANGKGGFLSFWRSSERKSKVDSGNSATGAAPDVVSSLPPQHAQDLTVDSIQRSGEIVYEPLRKKVDVYHSGLPQDTKGTNKLHAFTHAVHKGEVELVEKADVKTEAYRLSLANYEGPLSKCEKEPELDPAPIRQYASTYHPGQSYFKSRKRLPLSGFRRKDDYESNTSEEEGGGGDEIKKTEKLPLDAGQKNGGKADKGHSGVLSLWRPGVRKSKDISEDVADNNVQKTEFPAEYTSQDSILVPKAYILDQYEGIPNDIDHRFVTCLTDRDKLEASTKEHLKDGVCDIDLDAEHSQLEETSYESELPFAPIHDFSSLYHSGKSVSDVAECNVNGEQRKELPTDRPRGMEQGKVSGGFMSFPIGRKFRDPGDERKVFDDLYSPSSKVPSDPVSALPLSKEITSEALFDLQSMHIDELEKPVTSVEIQGCERKTSCDIGEHVKRTGIELSAHKIPLSENESNLERLNNENELPVAPLREHSSVYHPGNSYTEEKDTSKRASTSFKEQTAKAISEPKKHSLKEPESLEESKRAPEVGGGLFSFWRGRKWNDTNEEKKIESNDLYVAQELSRTPLLEESSFELVSAGELDRLGEHRPSHTIPDTLSFTREVRAGEIQSTEKADVNPEMYRVEAFRCASSVEKICHENELPTTAISDFCSVYHSGQSLVERSEAEKQKMEKFENDPHIVPEQSSSEGDRRGLFSFWRSSEREAEERGVNDSEQTVHPVLSTVCGPVGEISPVREISSAPSDTDAAVGSHLGGLAKESVAVHTFRRVTDYDSRTDATVEYPSVIGRKIELSSIKSGLAVGRAADDANTPQVPALFGRSSPATVGPVAAYNGSRERMPSFYTLQTYVSDLHSSVRSGIPGDDYRARTRINGERESRSGADYLHNSGEAPDSQEAATVGEPCSPELSPSVMMDDGSSSETPRTLIGYIRRRLTQSVAKPSEKRGAKKKNEKKKAKNAVDGGGSTSSSDSESKERQYRLSYVPAKEDVRPTEQLLSPSNEAPMCEGPVPWTKRTLESNEVMEVRNEGANVPSNHMSDEQELTRTKEAEMFEGRILLEERVDNSYRIRGTGISPTINPNDTESSAPHTTLESWHESNVGPESVVTDVDKYGNIIKKTVKTQQVKHTIQRQTYQTYSLSGEGEQPGVQTVEASQQVITPIGGGVVMSGTTPIVETRSHTVAYEAGQEPFGSENGFQRSDIPGELISCRTISSGNRTVETITYKTEKDGIVEIHVEHRVTIHSGANIDHDAELSQAILEATNMNPDMTVEKIEVKQESQC
uniref:Moesin/ezrin/radixin homolog 1 n=1 Tax=Parascaris univalens TaxID=6257 RepID=A0A915AD62_PARUN